MKTLPGVLFCLMSFSPMLWGQAAAPGAGGEAKKDAGVPSKVYIPDGQLVSSPVEVYVTGVDLTSDQKPRLEVFTASNATAKSPLELWPARIIPNASFVLNRQEEKGTLLLFDFEQEVEVGVSAYERIGGTWLTGLFTSGRFMPVLVWGKPGQEQAASVYMDGTVRRSVIVGSLWRAGVGMVAVVLSMLICIGLWSRVHSGSVCSLLMSEGYASLSRFQLFLWTVAAVTFVGIFGVAKKELPDIPSSLIVLMGLSLVTTGSAYASATRAGAPSHKETAEKKLAAAELEQGATAARWRDAEAALRATQAAAALPGGEVAQAELLAAAEKAAALAKERAQEAEGRAAAAREHLGRMMGKRAAFRFADLLSDLDADTGLVVMSVAKAQMFLWTIVSVLLFTSKSIMNGELWVVPWELVVLMGISQASYLAPKYWTLGPAPASPKGA